MYSNRTRLIVDTARALKNEDSSDSNEDFDSDDSVRDENYLPSSDASENSGQESDIEHSSVNMPVVDANEDLEARENRGENESLWTDVSASSNLLFAGFSDEEIYNVPELARSPFDFFKLLVSDDIIDIFVDETNAYAARIIEAGNLSASARMKFWKPTCAQEMNSFFAAILAMGLIHNPTINSYWSKDPLYHNAFISNIMPRDRFILLLRCLHFTSTTNSAEEDRLYKIRPIIEPLLRNFQFYLVPGKSLVIDESVIPWRGRLLFRQYIKNKTHPYGVKVYKLCTVGGYILRFKVYTGKGTDLTSGRGHPEAVVNNLLQGFTNVGRTLFCDNFYTSVQLADHLLQNKTRICGTIRSNRKGLPQSVTKKKLKKGEIVGEQKDNVKVIKWVDKRPVLMLSTCEEHGAELVETGTIRRNTPVQKPLCVMDYNRAKKGVDFSDQMTAYYDVLRKTKKWYRKVALALIVDASVTNAWILYNAKFGNHKMSMLDFRNSLCKSLVSSLEQPPRPRTPKRIHTLVEYGPENKRRRRCTGCYKILRQTMSSKEADKKTKQVTTYCQECEGQPTYCLKCFNNAHEK